MLKQLDGSLSVSIAFDQPIETSSLPSNCSIFLTFSNYSAFFFLSFGILKEKIGQAIGMF